MKTTLVLFLFCAFSMVAFAQQDSLPITAIVKKEIYNAKLKEQQPPVNISSASMLPEEKQGQPVISEAWFIVMFFGAQVLLAGAFAIYRLRRKQTNISGNQLKKRANKDLSGKKNSNRNSQEYRLRSLVSCQLQLVRTQEEIREQARKMNISTGELELAMKLQEFSTSA